MNQTDKTLSPYVWVSLCALSAALAASWVAWVPLGGVPHVSDEIAYTMQSRLLAENMRTGGVADNASMWLYPFWNNEGPMFSPFPVGWPWLLSLGERVELAPWVNPLLCALLPLLLFRIGRAVGGVQLGVLAAFFVAFSPGVWILGGSRMAHTSVLVALGTVMVVALERAKGHWAWTVGGMAAAYVVAARPYDAALLAAPLLVWGGRRAPRKTVLVGWFLMPFVAGVMVLSDNHAITGDFFRFPISDWYDAWQDRAGCNRLGFGADVGCAQTLGSWGHTPKKAFDLAVESAIRFDRLLLGVPGGSLLAIAFALHKRARRGWMWVALVVFGYALYWSPGRAYGARFWHPLYLVVPVALALGLQDIRRLWVVVSVTMLSVFGVSRVSVDLASSYWCTDPRIANLVEARAITEGVLFVRSTGRRQVAWPSMGVEQFVCDPLLVSGNAWMLAHPERLTGGLQIRHALPDVEQTRAFMARHHPGQPAWLIHQDVGTGSLSMDSLGILAPH